MIKLTTRGALTDVIGECNHTLSSRDPLSLLQEQLAFDTTPPPIAHSNLPFFGGAIGYFGYDLHRRLEPFASKLQRLGEPPEMMIGIYDWCVIVDHQEKSVWLISRHQSQHSHRQRDFWLKRLKEQRAIEPLLPIIPVNVRNNTSASVYRSSFQKIQHYITEGDCYQINLTQQFQCQPKNTGWDIYKWLRITNPAPYSAYLKFGRLELMCSSPERFLQLKERTVETKPIKGTRPRGESPLEDARLKEALAHSAKDRAENLMIVDLLRNDLGKVCQTGSVITPHLFEIESFQSVHHLVSTVRGQLAQGEDAFSLLKACFPGGSITGAPKTRATEIIEEVEASRRGVYCGSIGYIGFSGEMDTNIVIRTLVLHQGLLTFSAGGGIVADSESGAEFQETYDKANALIALFQTP